MTTADTLDGQKAAAAAAITIADPTVPSEVVPSKLSGNENATIMLTGISVSASPITGDPLSMVLSVSHGSITAGGQTGASVTLNGTAVSINAALAGASYIGGPNYYGSDTLLVTTTDTIDGQKATGSAAITVVDVFPTTTPVTLGVAENAGPTPIHIAAPLDPNFPVASVIIKVTALPSDGTVTLADGKTKVTVGETLTAAQLTGLEFAPTTNVFEQSSALTYSVSDPVQATTGTATLAVGPNPPSAPSLGMMLGAPGASQTTNLAQPVFTGTAVAGSTLKLYADGGTVAIGTSQANAQGVWTVTPTTGLSAGNHTITATATDPLGITSAPSGSSPITVTSPSTTSFPLGNPNAVLQIGNGSASVTAGNGNDVVIVGNGNDTIQLGNGRNTVELGNGADNLTIGGGPNTVILAGGTYTVTAGGGPDLFIFTTPQSLLTMAFANNDEFVFRNSGFDLGADNGLGTSTPQAIAASLFSPNTNGTFASAGNRFAYNQTNGDLFYDAQGSSSPSSAMMVADLTNHAHLTAANLFFIS